MSVQRPVNPPPGSQGPSQSAPPSPPPSKLQALLRRKGVRPALTALTIILFVAGGTLLAYPLLTDLYTDRVVQSDLEEEFGSADQQQQYEAQTLADDDPLTRIIIPELDVDTLVVAGTTQAALRAGAGHYRDTPLPGEEGNVGIAGHRTTYGKPFAHLEQLTAGDEVILDTPLATHTYQVIPTPGGVARPCGDAACWITGPDDWSVVDQLEGRYLTMTTCHPRGSDRQRLIVRAELVETEPHDETNTAG